MSFEVAKRIKGFDLPSVWTEFSPLAVECNAVNMGQGFPNFLTPDFVKQNGRHAIEENFNQYARSQGHASLVQSIAKKYSKSLGRSIDPMSQVFVGVGASGVLFCAFQSLLNQGDEVVAFEPTFDIYSAQIQMAGGQLRTVPLKIASENGDKPQWTYDPKLLEEAINDKTRILLLNTPHNPTGMCLSLEQLQHIDEVCKKYPNCVIVSDEVYEHQVYDGKKHITSASISESMWNRTLTISSAGKMFSCTGWKIGWAVGPPALVKTIWLSHQWMVFSVATPLQEGIAKSLEQAEESFEKEDSYYSWVQKMYETKRDRLVQLLEEAGFPCVVPQGGYFVMANTGNFKVPQQYLDQNYIGSDEPGVTRDWAMCRWLTREAGVSPIPPSAFCSGVNKKSMADYARFAICKKDEDIEECGKRLKKFAQEQNVVV